MDELEKEFKRRILYGLVGWFVGLLAGVSTTLILVRVLAIEDNTPAQIMVGLPCGVLFTLAGIVIAFSILRSRELSEEED